MTETLSQLRRLIGNPNAYALQHEDGTWNPVRKKLTDAVLEEHMTGYITVGTYIGYHVQTGDPSWEGPNGETDPVEEFDGARTLVFDLDTKTAFEEAAAIQGALAKLDVPVSCIGLEVSGRKGYHVWVVLADYRPLDELRRVGRAALALADVKCEVFPKQDELKDLGNLVKLPGGIHQVTQKPAHFLGHIPRPLLVEKWEDVVDQLPKETRERRTQADVRFPCMEALQDDGSVEGSRNIELFHLATLLRRAGVSDENTRLVAGVSNARTEPPLDEDEFETLLESSKTSGPICSQIRPEIHCGELCMLERTAGLFTRPRQLANAADGENVVVTVKNRKGRVMELEHDDIGRAKAVLRATRGGK